MSINDITLVTISLQVIAGLSSTSGKIKIVLQYYFEILRSPLFTQ